MSSTLKTAVLLAFLSGLLIVAGGALAGRGGVIIAFGFAVLMNVGSYWFSDKIVLRMYRANPVGPDHPLHRITARLAQKAGLPMPKVYLIPDMSPNAFATGRNPQNAAVAATEGLLRLLPEPEVEGVIAHELAHVKHRDILISTVAATIGAAITMLAHMAYFIPIGSRDDDRGGIESAGGAGDDPARTDGRDDHSAGDFAAARVWRRSRRRGDCGLADGPRVGAAANRVSRETDPDGRQPGHGAHVHHEPVRRRRHLEAVLQPSADGRAREGADGAERHWVIG